MKNTKGITLIALIVTVIVILILAGISIAVLTGDNGIINNAKQAKIANEAGTVNEEVKLATTVLNMEITKNRTKYSSFDAANFINTTTDGIITVNKSLVGILEGELVDPKYTVTPGTGEITIEYNSPTYNKTFLITVTRKLATLGEPVEDSISIDFELAGTKLNTANLSSLSSIEALPTITAGTKAETKSRYTDSDNNIAIIPQGATVSTVSGEQNINTGLVIRDDNQNEYVWIPVDIDQSLRLQVTSEDPITGITLIDPIGNEISVGSYSGTEYPETNLTPTVNGKYKVQVTTENETKTKTLMVRSLYAEDGFNDWYETDEYINGLIEEVPVLNSEEDIYTQSGTSNRSEFAVLVAANRISTETEDYSAMVNSYGGFYIGRYEAGIEGGTLVSKPNIAVYNNISTESAKYLADGKYSGMSHLVTASAWDRTLGFLLNTNNKTLSEILGSSSNWGNYADSTIPGTGAIADTASFGASTRANNIYDLAGNVSEWTSAIEADDINIITCRW